MSGIESEGHGPGLEARLARLESQVERLVAEVQAISEGREVPGFESLRPEPEAADPASPASGTSAGPGPTLSRQPQPAPRPSLSQRLAGSGERWLARLGIGFVVLAVAFLLKLGFDRGWITPLFRLWLGGGVGVALLILGLRVEPRARRLSQALLGGSIAVFYLVGWAGFQLYHLIPLPVVFALMCTTTVLAIALAERQDSPFLSVVGISGGLLTPFLLNTGSNNVAALAIYLTLILLGGGLIHFLRGWHSLLGTLILGGAAVLVVVIQGDEGAAVLPLVALATFWLVGVGSPLARWVVGPEGGAEGGASGGSGGDVGLGTMAVHRASLFWTTGFTALLFSTLLDFGDLGLALTFLALGMVLAVTAWGMRPVRPAAWPAAETAALALLAALWIYPGSEAAIFLTASAAALLLVLRAQGAPGRLDVVAHCSFAATGLVFVITSSGTDPAWFGGLLGGGLFRLGALAMAAVASIQLAGPARTLYQSAVYLGLLLWSYSIFHPMSNGAGLVSAAWTVQGAVALMTAGRQESQLLQFKGLGTIALVAAKMLLFDLSELDPVWRILLFMGFGVGLLSLAWLLNRAGSAGGQKPAQEAAEEP